MSSFNELGFKKPKQSIFRQRRRMKIEVEGKSMTEQSHKDSCDINTILRRYQKTGILEHVNKYQGKYMEYPDSTTFHDAMNLVAEANSLFESIPSQIRAEFDNDPSKFIDFMQNPDNREKMEDMGLSSEHLPLSEKEILAQEAAKAATKEPAAPPEPPPKEGSE